MCHHHRNKIHNNLKGNKIESTVSIISNLSSEAVFHQNSSHVIEADLLKDLEECEENRSNKQKNKLILDVMEIDDAVSIDSPSSGKKEPQSIDSNFNNVHKCPKCGNEDFNEIHEELDKTNIIMTYPRLYGTKFHCDKCDTEWNSRNDLTI